MIWGKFNVFFTRSALDTRGGGGEKKWRVGVEN